MVYNRIEHTFVILAYKESKYLERCIQSVINQTVKGNVIIATSTPNQYITCIAAKYGIEIFVNYNSGSIGKDWNFGYYCAATKYVIIAHQDDVYLARFAERFLDALSENVSSRPLMVFNKSIHYKGEKKLGISYKNILRWLFIFPFHFKKCISSKSLKKSILLFSNSISCPGVLYVKENLNHFSFDERAVYILDWKAWYEMSRIDGAFIYVPEALHIHREHEESATSAIDVAELQKEEFELLAAIWGNKFIAKIIAKLLLLAK